MYLSFCSRAHSPPHLMLFSLLLPSLLLLLATRPGLLAQDAKSTPLPPGTAINSTPVDAAKCQFPFRFNNVMYFGCTTAGDSNPWCVVPSSADRGPQDWRYCDKATIGAALNQVAGVTCANGWTNGQETVYGCIIGANDKSYGCNPTGSSVTPCTNVSSAISGGGTSTAVVQAVSSPSGSSTSSSKPSIGVIIGGSVGGVVLIAFVVGIFAISRRGRNKKSTWSSGKNNGVGSLNNANDGFNLDVSGPHASAEDLRFATSNNDMMANPSATAPIGNERYYPVISTYTPTLGDELEIQPGDKVQMVIEYDDGWCQGINLSRGGAKGVFPKHCIDMSSPT